MSRILGLDQRRVWAKRFFEMASNVTSLFFDTGQGPVGEFRGHYEFRGHHSEFEFRRIPGNSGDTIHNYWLNPDFLILFKNGMYSESSGTWNPHHITQRSHRRQQTFFCDEDYSEYVHLMSEWCSKLKVECWAYCLMPNHVHLILVPSDKEWMNRAVGEAHRRYTRMINFREGWRGHLWRF